MKKFFGILVAFGSAAGLVLLWRRLFVLTPQRLHQGTARSDQVQSFPPPIPQRNLLDLNSADETSLLNLQLDPPSVERLIENRPYRSKLELVSRMVLTEAEYELIRDRVIVTESQEPVKIA